MIRMQAPILLTAWSFELPQNRFMKIVTLLFMLALPAAPVAFAQSSPAPANQRAALPQALRTPQQLYQAAAATAQRNEPRMALRQLKQAIALGFFTAESIEADAAFAPLHNQAGWPVLLKMARTKQQQHEATLDPQLLARIKKLYYQDQYYRNLAEAAERQYGVDAPQMRAAMAKQDRLDPQLLQQVDSLIAVHGYPGKSKVGEYYKSTAFLVIQHNPNEKYLPLLTAAADKGELNWSSVALLVDRVKTGKGELQVYGSQLGPAVNGKYTLDPIEDEPNVNVRRAKVGLSPLEEYLKPWGIAYQVPTAAHNPNTIELYTAAQTEAEDEHKSAVELIGSYENLYASLSYPAEARQKAITGHVTLQLTIDPRGVPQNVVVVQGLGAGCDEEALRVMRTARFTNPGGHDHEIRMRLPFPYEAAVGK